MSESLANLQSMGKYEYSTTETLTNKVWIDGKPIYKKTIDCGALPNATSKSVPHGITGIGEIIAIDGTAYESEYTIKLPHTSQSNITYQVGITVTNTNINLASGGNLSGYTHSYVTLQYTKS